MSRLKLVLVWTVLLLSAAGLAVASESGFTEKSLGADGGPAGWEAVSPGVWQTRAADGALLTWARGSDGLVWAQAELEGELVRLTEAYLADPTSELFEQLEQYIATLHRMSEAILAGGRLGLRAAAPPEPQPEPPLGYCNELFNYDADGSAGALNPGATAAASSHWNTFHNPYCYGTAYARATAQVTSGGVTTTQSQVCSIPNSLAAFCDVSASVTGSGTCSSSAFSYAWSDAAGVYVSKSASNSVCGYGVYPKPAQ